MKSQIWDIVVVGAGMGGLAASARLAASGLKVLVLERQPGPGGKARTIPSAAGPVDAGPTVMTLPHVFADLFRTSGREMESYVDLIRHPRLARHFWKDGSSLDLWDDPARNRAAIADFAGAGAAEDFARFQRRTRLLYESFEEPVMLSDTPSLARISAKVMSDMRLLSAMAPLTSMAKLLERNFSDRRLAQLFGRYATYVGGAPDRSPALSSLIWEAEHGGVWQARGGMGALAEALCKLAQDSGAVFQFNADVASIEMKAPHAAVLSVAGGADIRADKVIFNGDPNALAMGHLGRSVQGAVTPRGVGPRAHSAQVWSFAAKAEGVPLATHNVFFADDPMSEFVDLGKGALPKEPSIYVHAQDRAFDTSGQVERFEIILNAPALAKGEGADPKEFYRCKLKTFGRLEAMGLRFDRGPQRTNLTTPMEFARLYPGSMGSLYGRSPHGMMATFHRPTARSKIPGLYLAGGGCHPGPGIPMATLSGKHAADAILTDLTSQPTSRRTATPGGTSTDYQMTKVARSR